jgi:hypothetical protein
MPEFCNRCGIEAEMQFSGGPGQLKPAWWCEECFTDEYPEHRAILDKVMESVATEFGRAVN